MVISHGHRKCLRLFLLPILLTEHEIVPLSNADVEILKSGNWVAEKVEIYSTVGQLPVT